MITGREHRGTDLWRMAIRDVILPWAFGDPFGRPAVARVACG